jgi:hypothetical protein
MNLSGILPHNNPPTSSFLSVVTVCQIILKGRVECFKLSLRLKYFPTFFSRVFRKFQEEFIHMLVTGEGVKKQLPSRSTEGGTQFFLSKICQSDGFLTNTRTSNGVVLV